MLEAIDECDAEDSVPILTPRRRLSAMLNDVELDQIQKKHKPTNFCTETDPKGTIVGYVSLHLIFFFVVGGAPAAYPVEGALEGGGPGSNQDGDGVTLRGKRLDTVVLGVVGHDFLDDVEEVVVLVGVGGRYGTSGELVDEIGFGGFWLFGFDAVKKGSLLGRNGNRWWVLCKRRNGVGMTVGHVHCYVEEDGEMFSVLVGQRGGVRLSITSSFLRFSFSLGHRTSSFSFSLASADADSATV
ncbi:transcription factor TGA5-like [Pyrus ussuriensis x Pyrus communis]|uniref:Transcription factor TGA5-like n=1 Tax=Pyrus ussuriensis x Pyrus communis TaxID=2448454 RepID=A0A5N5GKX7_9ROSA|nr:transcription factor TGA5-like [Pyrus ussuriensis x Pyrus communis]